MRNFLVLLIVTILSACNSDSTDKVKSNADSSKGVTVKEDLEKKGTEEIKQNGTKVEPVDKYIGSWSGGYSHLLTISKFGSSYKITECANCPFSGVLKEGVLYISGLPCVYDDKSDHILLDGTEYSRVK